MYIEMVGGMAFFINKFPKPRRSIVKKFLFFEIAIMLYLLCHTFAGNSSIAVHNKLVLDLDKKKYVLQQRCSKNNTFKTQIAMLSPNSIDLDYLDELARATLNYSDSKEYVVLYDKSISNAS